jgi:hypothetical protein
MVDAVGAERSDLLPTDPKEAFQPQAERLGGLFHKEDAEFDFGALNDEWKQRIAQVNALGATADEATIEGSGFRLTEIDLGLTITAEGHLAFVASASAQATIQLKFTR